MRGAGSLAIERRFGGFSNAVEDRLLGWRARKIRVGPDEPMLHPLKRSEALVRTLDDGGGVWITRGIFQQQHGTRLGVAVTLETDDHAIAHGRLFAQLRFQVLRENVQALGRDDYIFSAAFEIKIARLVAFAEIAGVEPSIGVRNGNNISALPVALCNIRAAHQDFAVFR